VADSLGIVKGGYSSSEEDALDRRYKTYYGSVEIESYEIYKPLMNQDLVNAVLADPAFQSRSKFPDLQGW
jgi:hypothetical protein